MIKSLVHIFLFILTVSQITAQNNSISKIKDEGNDNLDSINDLTVLDMNNDSIKLSDYYGKVLLIVNVASECGFTGQYKGLQEIYERYNSQDFEILAFPCNDFGGQEPGTNEQIQNFCSTNFGITFKLFDKIRVLGEDKSPLYERLTNNSVTEKGDIKWNFEKFLISKEGKIVARYRSSVPPTSDELICAIENELGLE
jgi:glutathione peroxidase